MGRIRPSDFFIQEATMSRKRLVVAVFAMMAAVAAVQAQGGRGRWVQLGERVVTDRQDHDTIGVGQDRGTFRAVRFDVSGHAVDFQRVVIHFKNGDDQKLELRHTIPAGQSSREIDIPGTDRVIKSIDFWYDAKTMGRGGKATVRAMGRN
jgi:hypothetical protein